jgi:RNA polymerase sigma-70 factor, ECF subfamily
VDAPTPIPFPEPEALHAAGTTQNATRALVGEAYLAHGPALVGFLRAYTRDFTLAEDLAQEAFLRLAREVAAGRTPDNVGAWLFRVGRNLATSRARRSAVATRLAPSLVQPGSQDAPEAIAIRAEQTDALRAAMADLPADHRAAVLLAAAGYPGPEIAARLHRTPLATRALLCRVRGRLRLQLMAAGMEP